MGRGKGNCPGGPIRYWYWDNRLFVLKQTNGLQGIKGSTAGMMTVGERTLVSSINNLIIISIDPLTVTSLGRQFKLASRRKKEIRGIDLAAVKSRKFNSAIFGQVPWYLGVESPLPLSSFFFLKSNRNDGNLDGNFWTEISLAQPSPSARRRTRERETMTAGGNTLDDAIGKLDGLLLDMEKEAQSAGVKIPELRFDPDDPWAKERSLPPPYVVKVRCPKTGYLMTKPFEAQCPMPDAFVKDNSYLKGMINPVVKPANQAPAPSTSKSKSKTVVVGEVEDFAKVLFKVSRSLFLLRFFLLFPFSLSLFETFSARFWI